jgi:transcriptional regulator with XRE-family HTH domain
LFNICGSRRAALTAAAWRFSRRRSASGRDDRAKSEGEVLTVGERIKEAMARLGLDDTQLAMRMGVAKQTVVSWKSDKHAVRRRYIPRLAEMLGLERVDLSRHGGLPAPINQDGDTNVFAYFRRIDSTVSRMTEDIDLVNTRLANLEGRVTSLEAAVHKRLDGIHKHLDNIGARLHRTSSRQR